MPITNEQRDVLLKPLAASRINKRDGNSYLEAWDVRAHLTRLFDFGGWSSDVLENVCAFEDLSTEANRSGKFNWNVCYRATLRLTIFGLGPNGENVTFTETSCGTSHQPDRGEAHDMACKTAESDAIKRAAANLGTQFGLSLYNSGGTADVVKMIVGVTKVTTDAA